MRLRPGTSPGQNSARGCNAGSIEIETKFNPWADELPQRTDPTEHFHPSRENLRMSVLRVRTSLAVFLFCHISNSILWGADDTQLRASVLANYPKALESLGSQYSRIQGRGIMRFLEVTTPMKREAVSLGVDFEFGPGRRVLRRFAPIKGLLDVTTGPSESTSIPFTKFPEKVLLFNPGYSARLNRKIQEGSFSIEAIDPNPDVSRRGISLAKGYLLDCATTADAIPIDRLMKLPQFRLDRAERERAEDGSDRVRIVYSMVWESFPEKAAVVRSSGWLIVDPSHQWILHEAGTSTVTDFS